MSADTAIAEFILANGFKDGAPLDALWLVAQVKAAFPDARLDEFERGSAIAINLWSYDFPEESAAYMQMLRSR